ncbi:MAG TPA: hypothetical protein EYP63_00580 [Desulfotomaculum sp.]|nr:hypothetical protein [Desulfotomaculum sp.]
MPTKSVGVSIILTVLLGPLGMLYSTIWGGLIMFVVSALVGLLTFGLGLVVTWPICVIWAALAASSYNKRLLSGQRQF